MPVDAVAVVAQVVQYGRTGSDVGREFGITRERVRQLVLRDAGRAIGHAPAPMYRCHRCGGEYQGVNAEGRHIRSSRHAAWRRADREATFWGKVSKSDGCWEWTGAHDPEGYGHASMRWLAGAGGYTHRAAYILAVGPIPAGLTIDHLCRNRGCVNPSHLEAVTTRENTLRSPITLAAINLAKTRCAHGHLFDEANTSRDHRGHRRCRTCNREQARAQSARRTAQRRARRQEKGDQS